MRRLGLAAAFALASSHAYALSCAQPNIERSFNWWAEAEETYYIGVGTLKPIGAVPKVPNELDPNGGFDDKEPITAKFLFSGRLLDGQQGQPAELPITVSVGCLGPWCGNFPTGGKEGLMALRGTDVNNLTLTMSACPGTIFPAETEATVSACMRAGKCAESTAQ